MYGKYGVECPTIREWGLRDFYYQIKKVSIGILRPKILLINSKNNKTKKKNKKIDVIKIGN